MLILFYFSLSLPELYLISCFDIAFAFKEKTKKDEPFITKMNLLLKFQVYSFCEASKKELYARIKTLYNSIQKRRPLCLDVNDGIDCLFRLIRTGMQWRELEIKSVSYTSLFKHVGFSTVDF